MTLSSLASILHTWEVMPKERRGPHLTTHTVFSVCHIPRPRLDAWHLHRASVLQKEGGQKLNK